MSMGFSTTLRLRFHLGIEAFSVQIRVGNPSYKDSFLILQDTGLSVNAVFTFFFLHEMWVKKWSLRGSGFLLKMPAQIEVVSSRFKGIETLCGDVSKGLTSAYRCVIL